MEKKELAKFNYQINFLSIINMYLNEESNIKILRTNLYCRTHLKIIILKITNQKSIISSFSLYEVRSPNKLKEII